MWTLTNTTHVLVLTGAGISAESGVPTFRDADGLWQGRDVTQVASPEGFAADRLHLDAVAWAKDVEDGLNPRLRRPLALGVPIGGKKKRRIFRLLDGAD